jgi:hypothetical protein
MVSLLQSSTSWWGTVVNDYGTISSFGFSCLHPSYFLAIALAQNAAERRRESTGFFVGTSKKEEKAQRKLTIKVIAK